MLTEPWNTPCCINLYYYYKTRTYMNIFVSFNEKILIHTKSIYLGTAIEGAKGELVIFSMSGIPCEPPSRSFTGQVAIITGAGCSGDGIGNGRAISIMLADEGCNVVCVDRELAWATRTCEMIRTKTGRGSAIAIQGDVTSLEDCKSAVQLTLDRFGRLDILVNNVGVAGAPGTAVDVDMEQWARSLEINVSSMVMMAKYAIPAMRKKTGK